MAYTNSIYLPYHFHLQNDTAYRGMTAMLYQHHMIRSGDYDDKMISSSPPLELRRPGSGPPRTIAVPHSLQSPQDRTAAGMSIYIHIFKYRYSY